MSNYYKEQKKLIMKMYEKFGWENRAMQYLCLSLSIITAYSLLPLLTYSSELDSGVESYKGVWFLAILTVGSYFLMKFFKNKNLKMRTNALRRYNDTSISNENIDSLISEVEKKIDKTNTLATWITGIFVTILVLTVTTTSNYIFKFFDVLFKVMPKDELDELYQELATSQNSLEDVIMTMFLVIKDYLITLLVIVLIVYLSIAMLNVLKKEVLYFLYDVRYMRNEKKDSNHEEVIGDTLNE